jgi:multidrug resistance efflux pump
VSDQAKVGADREKLQEAQAKLTDAQSSEEELKEQLNQAIGQVGSLNASLELARKRVGQNTELVSTGAGNRFDLEQAQTNVSELTAQLAGARAQEQQVRAKLGGRVKGDLATVAQVKAQIASAVAQVKISEAAAATTQAQLDNAKWDLSQTRTVAPGNGTMVNVQLRPGAFVGQAAASEQMTFVDNEYQIYALFGQNELHQVEPGNEAEITLDTYPGRIIKAHVDSILWAQSQGQMDASGNLPQTTFTPPPGRFPVKLVIGEKDKDLFLAAGALGAAAIYTDHFGPIQIIRKVLIRVESYLDYVIIKHAISLGH